MGKNSCGILVDVYDLHPNLFIEYFFFLPFVTISPFSFSKHKVTNRHTFTAQGRDLLCPEV